MAAATLLAVGGCLFPTQPPPQPPTEYLGCWNLEVEPELRVYEDSLRYAIPAAIALRTEPVSAYSDLRWTVWPLDFEIKPFWVAHNRWGPAWRELRHIQWNEDPRSAPAAYRNPGDTLHIVFPTFAGSLGIRVAGTASRLTGRAWWHDDNVRAEPDAYPWRMDHPVTMTRTDCSHVAERLGVR